MKSGTVCNNILIFQLFQWFRWGTDASTNIERNWSDPGSKTTTTVRTQLDMELVTALDGQAETEKCKRSGKKEQQFYLWITTQLLYWENIFIFIYRSKCFLTQELEQPDIYKPAFLFVDYF